MKWILVALVVVAVAAIAWFAVGGGGGSLPTGEAAGVESPGNAPPMDVNRNPNAGRPQPAGASDKTPGGGG